MDKIARETLAHRKIGLGVMGFADLCILLRIPYASSEALDMAGRLMGFIAADARSASHNLAEERGVFPHWNESIYTHSNLRLRNATTTSIAPTGTLSILAGTSPSIEPLFALAYRRRVLENQVLTEFSPLVLRHLMRVGGNVERAMDEVASTGRLGSMGDGADLFKTALEIDPEHHVRIQAAFQKHVDNAVSKTVNLPRDATPQSVAEVYRLAHRLGCKGVTVFRYGSRSDVVLELGLGQTPEECDNFTQCDPAACRL